MEGAGRALPTPGVELCIAYDTTGDPWGQNRKLRVGLV